MHDASLPTLNLSGRLPVVDPARCTGCGRCVAACTDLHLLSLEARGWDKLAVLGEGKRCTGCSECAVVCPFHAITMKRVQRVDWVERAVRSAASAAGP